MTFRNTFKSFANVLFLWSSLLTGAVHAQVSPEEHAKHHPGAGAPTKQMASGQAASSSAMSGGMGDMMKEMMDDMGTPKKKEFYPSLMDMPRLSEETKAALQQSAHNRMKSGAALMNRALFDLTKAAESNNYSSMKGAAANIREGLAQLESGIATHELLERGKAPSEIALSWFNENLNLKTPEADKQQERTFWGLSLFHIFIMALLSLFTLVMILMYFFKMKRAATLLSRLETGSVSSLPQTTQLQSASESSHSTQATNEKPVNLSRWKGKLRVASIYQETPTVKTFKFVSTDGGDLPFTYLAGQFLNLAAVIDGKAIKRAYTISSHPCDRKMLELTIKREENGLVSRYMHDVVHEGDLIDIEAAYGQLTFSGVDGKGIVLIGGGVGITPLMSVLRCLIACGMKNEIHLLYACKSLDELVYREELRQLQERNKNLKLVVAVDKLEGSFPGAFEGRLTKEKIQSSAPDIAKFRIHLCGPPGMMQAMRGILTELKIPEDQIKTEAFGPAKAPQLKSVVQTSIPTSSGTLKQVTFKKANKTVPIHEGETVLEIAETSGIEIPFSCRVGTCGNCKVRLLKGNVAMEVQDSLTDEDKRSGLILACQAKAQSNLEIEEP